MLTISRTVPRRAFTLPHDARGHARDDGHHRVAPGDQAGHRLRGQRHRPRARQRVGSVRVVRDSAEALRLREGRLDATPAQLPISEVTAVERSVAKLAMVLASPSDAIVKAPIVVIPAHAILPSMDFAERPMW